MCGIAGFIDARRSEEQRTVALWGMCQAMQHRGPDDVGVVSRGPATLGMRRLAIFDPARGQQPMQSPDGRLALVFNGAIYNFRELRRELAAAGWSFRTECDTEVLLAAFHRWGEACLRRLRGMFAFAVWDSAEQFLFLARDPFGIKPLYFHHHGDRFAFASEIRGLLASEEIPAEIDPAAVVDYLAWLAVPAPRTIYRGITSLRPGECLTLRRGERMIRRHWTFPTAPSPENVPAKSRPEFIRELRHRLEDTIRAHLLADVPVGAFLSGGLDSAVVVGLMARLGGPGLKTFSIGFDEPEFSESDIAAETARRFGTVHETRRLTGTMVADDLNRLIATLDQPTGDGINTFYASETARNGGVKVALSGLGGDELFGGYPSFRDVPRLQRWQPLWRAIPPSARRAITNRLARGDTRDRKLADLLRHARTPHELAALQRRVFSESASALLLQRDVARTAQRPFHPELETLSAELPDTDLFRLASAWELRTYMADVLLRDSDVMSMRHSLELRVPLIDRPLVEWLWSQPTEWKWNPQHPKSPLYEAVHDLLPAGLANRPKRGFTLPFPVWMKRELKPFLDEVFSDRSLEQSGLFSRAGAQQLWSGFVSGHDPREWSRVWSLAVLIAFANRRPAKVHPPTRPSTTITSATAPRPGPARAASLSGRTLLLAPEIFASEGGIARILQLYLRALCDLSATPADVRLLALNDDRVDADDLRAAGAEGLGAWRACSRHKLRFVAAALRLSRDCDRIVCGHVAQLPVAWLAQRANPRLRYYLVAHGIEVWRPFSAAERIALLGAAGILCVSDHTRQELLKHCPLPAGRAVVLPNGLDPRFTIHSGRPLSSCPPVILVVTRLTAADRYKGVEHMIEAMPRILAAIPEARLRIVGRGDDSDRLKGLRTQLGLNGAVEFTGFVPDEQLADEMQSCRLFALPSRKEGFGLVYLEAMAHGRPCLGARSGGVPEVITADTGVLVEYGDIPALADATVAALRRDWQPEALRRHVEGFSYPMFRDKLATLLAA